MGQTTDVGALWSRKGPKGEFWSGTIDVDALAQACAVAGQDPKRVQVVMFRNQYTTTKSGKQAPAFKILHDTWKPGDTDPKKAVKPMPPDDLDDTMDSVPF